MSDPTARPVTSSRKPDNLACQAASQRFSSRTQPAFKRPASYLTPQRLHLISRQLTDRDQRLLELVAACRMATGDQLTRIFWHTSDHASSPARSARRTLKRLADWRVFDRLPRRIGGIRAGSAGMIYTLGPAGLRLLAARDSYPRRLERPSDPYIEHTLAATEIVVRLQEADRAGEIELIQVQSEPDCWCSFTGFMGARLTLKPDLFVRLGAGEAEDRWMLEVDRDTATRRTLTGKLARYLNHYQSGAEQAEHGVYPRVLWLAPDEHRAEQIKTAIQQITSPARRIFTVCHYQQAISLMAREARS